MMKLGNYLDLDNLRQLIEEGYINERRHPTLPLRILNYSNACQFEQKWPHEVCACRGLIIDDQDNVVSRPQYKFFNLGQTSTVLDYEGGVLEYVTSKQTPAIVPDENVMVDAAYLKKLTKLYTDLTITRKMDGWAGILYEYEGQWGVSSRGSFDSPGAIFATQKFQKFVKYGATEFIPKGWSLFFEIISKELRIVIPYEWEGLCLLTAVNNETGEEMTYEQLHELWTNLNSYSRVIDADGVSQPGKPWCRIVEKFDIDLTAAVGDQSLEEEGYVVAVNRHGLPPVTAKIKLEEYKRLHRILTGVTPQMIWAEMSNPTSVWLEAGCRYDRKTGQTAFNMRVPANFSDWVLQWQRGMTNAFHENLVTAIKAQTELVAVRDLWTSDRFKNDDERKKWLRSPNGGSYSAEIVTAAMFLRSNRIVEAYEVLWKMVRPHGRDDRFYVEGKGE